MNRYNSSKAKELDELYSKCNKWYFPGRYYCKGVEMFDEMTTQAATCDKAISNIKFRLCKKHNWSFGDIREIELIDIPYKVLD